jgi:hypothetical protein
MEDSHCRKHDNEGKYWTMLTMTNATEVASVTKINNHISLYDPSACDASVDPTSQVS